MTDIELDAVATSEAWAATFDDATVVALRLADVVSCGHELLDDELIGELRAHFDEAELAELLLVAGQANLNNRVGNAAKRLLGPGPADAAR